MYNGTTSLFNFEVPQWQMIFNVFSYAYLHVYIFFGRNLLSIFSIFNLLFCIQFFKSSLCMPHFVYTDIGWWTVELLIFLTLTGQSFQQLFKLLTKISWLYLCDLFLDSLFHWLRCLLFCQNHTDLNNIALLCYSDRILVLHKITCWDFHRDCFESVDPVAENWHLSNVFFWSLKTFV